MKNYETACKMAIDLCNNWTFEQYSNLMDYCTDNNIDFFHDEEEQKIYIGDDYFQIKE